MSADDKPERRQAGRRAEFRDGDRRRTPGWKTLWNSVTGGRLFTPAKNDDEPTKS